MVKVYQTIEHTSGIPLGGIGTGSVEIRPDGLFHEWQIFNTNAWSPLASDFGPDAGSPCANKYVNPLDPEDLRFMVRTRTSDGAIVVRHLAIREDIHELYSLPWARSVRAIEFEGTFPIARLTYVDEDLPVQVQAEVFSPFIPLDSRSSGTPGFYVRFTVQNATTSPVEVSILGTIKNVAGYDQCSRVPHNRLMDVCGAKAVFLTAEDLAPGHPSTGDMTFAARGGDVSYVSGCFRDELKTLATWRPTSKLRTKALTFLHQFRDTGDLPNLAPDTAPRIPEGFSAADLSEPERFAVMADLAWHPFVYDKRRIVALADPAFVDTAEFLDDIAGDIAELKTRNIPWGWAALCSKHELSPGATKEALFTVGWHFPNHITATGENTGHRYEKWFNSSTDVTNFVIGSYTDLYRRTLGFADSIHGSTMPAEAADAVTSQLSTLTKCTWWTRDGHFGVWEGLGCCGFHTTDITYQGSFPIISLFPDLQKAQMLHGARFQREDGRVHHFFRPDFSKVDDGFDRVDMNQQFVMLAARDYLWTGDRDYLNDLWPHILKAMDNTALLDSDGDGLPDTDTRRNTYDNWDFTGCPSYISSLWLGALKAAIRLAGELGDAERARNWQDVYDKGVASFESKLWNGEYYVLCRDGDFIDECCMSDQISGDWFALASGWDAILPEERIKTAMRSVFQHNFQRGEGLLNATYPAGKPRNIPATGNFQADAPWTGVEYTVAALLIGNGMVDEGLTVVNDIHDRYLRAGRIWNHIECGGHYYRAMSSWTIMLALSGFRWEEPTGLLEFAPAVDEPACSYPFFTPQAWGLFVQEKSGSGSRVRVELVEGEMTIQEVRLPHLRGFGAATVVVGDSEADATIAEYGDGIMVRLGSPMRLSPDAPLIITS